MPQIFISIGSNEQPKRHITQALNLLADYCNHIQHSPWYLSQAVGAATGQFVNLVVRAETELPAIELVATLKSIERRCGRLKTNQTLDLDLLLYDDLILEEGAVRVPRSDIERFAFVLKPLVDLAPQMIHPVVGESYEQIWRNSELDISSLTVVSPDELD